MPMLVAEGIGPELDLSTHERLHWTIGRGQGADLVFNDPGISRYHATVFRVDKRFVVIDHSFNGTHVCGPTEGAHIDGDTKVPGFNLSDASVQVPRSISDKPHVARDENDTASFPAIIDTPKDSLRDRSDDHVHKSHAELRVQQLSSKLPRMIGFKEHAFSLPEKLQPLLRMIYSATEVDNLASMGRVLHPGTRLIFVGQKHNILTFIE